MATIDEIEIADDAGRWIALGFDVDGESCAIGGVALRLSGARDERGRASAGRCASRLRPSSTGCRRGSPSAESRPPALPHPQRRRLDRPRGRRLARAGAKRRGAPGGGARPAADPRGADAGGRAAAGVLPARPRDPRAGPGARGGRRASRAARTGRRSSGVLRCWSTTSTRRSPRWRRTPSPPRPAVQPGRRISTLGRSAGLAVPWP